MRLILRTICVLIPVVTLSANSILERQDFSSILSGLSSPGSQTAIAAAINVAVFGSTEYTNSELQKQLNDLNDEITGLETYVSTLSKVSIPSDSEFCTFAGNWVTYSAYTKTDTACTTLTTTLTGAGIAQGKTTDGCVAYYVGTSFTTPTACSSKKRKRSIFEWASTIKRNTQNLSPIFYSLTQRLKTRRQHQQRPKKPFSKIVYSTVKNVVDKLWSNRVFQNIREAYRERLLTKSKNKQSLQGPFNLSLLGNRIRRQFNVFSGFGGLMGKVLNAGFGGGMTVNTVSRINQQKSDLNSLISRLNVLKTQVESLESVKNNYLKGACTFAKSIATDLTTSTGTNIATEWSTITKPSSCS